MNHITKPIVRRYRVWIVEYGDCRPRDPGEVPPRARPLEPAEEGTMSAAEAALYTQSFNRAMLGRSRRLWAVAVPVNICYEGDLQPGDDVALPHSGRSDGSKTERLVPRPC